MRTRRLAAALIAAAVAVSLTACTPGSQEASVPTSPGAAPAPVTEVPEPGSPAPSATAPQTGTTTPAPVTATPSTPVVPADQPAAEPPQTVTAVAITPKEAPAALTTWVESQRMPDAPASNVVAQPDGTYLAISGGMQRTGGYKIVVDRVRREGDAWVVDARVVPPPPGTIVTMALTNPVAYFKLPAVSGQVRVNVQGPGTVGVPVPPKGDTADQATAGVQWPEPGRLQIIGVAPVPDLHFDLRAGSSLIGQADSQVKAGRYVANIQAAGTGLANLELTVSTVEPGGGKVLVRMPVGTNIPAGETWSTNFRVAPVRQTDPDTVAITGGARAFEAVFQVEIRAGNRILTRETVQAAEGAPGYGSFTRNIKVPGGVPAGAEAWFILVSPKDGSDSVDLVLPVQS